MEAENEELLLQFGRMKKVLEMMVVMMAQVWIHLMLLNCPLKHGKY